jgi:hypothetical protein
MDSRRRPRHLQPVPTVRTLRASGPADLLALVPTLLGFHPEESLVLVTVGAADAPVHARIDLPTTQAQRTEVGSHLTAVALRSGVRRAAVVAYGRDPDRCTAAGTALADRLLDESIEVVCGVRADGHRWWLLGRPGPGEPYDLAAHPLTTRAVVEGAVVLASRTELARSLVGHDGEEAARIAVLAADAGRVDPSGDVDQRWVGARVRRFLRDGRRLDTVEVARLAGGVRRATARGAAFELITRDTADRHVDLWRDVVRRCPPALTADPAGLLAFAAWVAGDGALAWCAVERALAVDPAHGLSHAVAHALETAAPPSVWR